MTIVEIVNLARRMMATLRNGCMRAIHYLRSLRLADEFIRWALLGI
jgi:hypothetical protein